tara:strand:+ start:1546 stop:2100 length:555 start_codon:yes stop_codon:yes gene_type:complete
METIETQTTHINLSVDSGQMSAVSWPTKFEDEHHLSVPVQKGAMFQVSVGHGREGRVSSLKLKVTGSSIEGMTPAQLCSVKVKGGYLLAVEDYLAISDPCYLDQVSHVPEWWQEEYHVTTHGYGAACEATTGDGDGAGFFKERSNSSGQSAFACETGYGDGSYPAIMEYDDDGKLTSLKVEFMV